MRRLFSTIARGAPGLGLLLLRAAAAAALGSPAAHMLIGRPTYAGVRESVLGAPGGVPVAVGLMTMSLALLDPGGWSIDARLFGWKRIESAPRKANGTPTD